MELRTFTMLLLAIAATMSILLSAVGLYGVIAYVANQRQAEMSVRVALGARVGQVRMMVLRQSVVLAAAGIVIGLFASIASSRALNSMLYGVHATDPSTLFVVSAVLLAVAAIAAWIPAVRAGRVQLMHALREE